MQVIRQGLVPRRVSSFPELSWRYYEYVVSSAWSLGTKRRSITYFSKKASKIVVLGSVYGGMYCSQTFSVSLGSESATISSSRVACPQLAVVSFRKCVCVCFEPWSRWKRVLP